jgi:hypothetical protein
VSLLTVLWNNRTMVMSVAQIVLSQLATSGLLDDYAVKWCMLGTGILTGLIALHNKIREIRAEKAAQETPE